MTEYLFKILDRNGISRYICVFASDAKEARKKHREISIGQGWCLFGVYKELK